MGGFSSPPKRGLLLFEGVGSENFAELDLKPRLTPMIWYLGRILGFELKKKKIREKERNNEGKYFLFLLYFEELISSLQKKLVQK